MGEFNGIFLVYTSADAAFNPTSKPLSEFVSQQAVFVRDPAAGHGWRAVALSPLQWQNTDVAKRTVQVQSVAVYKNGALVIQVTDPDSLYDVVNRIPRFHLGDTVRGKFDPLARHSQPVCAQPHLRDRLFAGDIGSAMPAPGK